ncbi:MAG: lysylphosphatidylglycerol synthase transmembrane domain-containing protein, partial [Bacteroidales bacterium]|nr:lysylphosphatidylglycerol synthase transmembrane domain-containing protein [Bacteroidales bacterium]
MNKKASKTLWYIIFLALGVALLWFSFRNIDLSQLWRDIKTAKYSWMLLSLVCLAISLFFRALRWNIQIEAMGYKTRSSSTYGAVLIAYLANCIFPRLGEVVRCSVLKRKENIPFDKSLGSVVSERIIDLTVLFGLAFLVIIFQWKLLGSLITSWLLPLIDKLVNNVLMGLVVIAAVVVFIVFLVKIIRKNKKLASIWHGFVDGIKSVVTMRQKWRFVLYTLGVWGFYVIMTWLPFYMLPETSHLGLVEAITLLGIATLGVVAPVPGGIGTYHFIAITLLSGFYGISEQAAGSFAAINHGSQMIFYLITGVLAYVVLF